MPTGRVSRGDPTGVQRSKGWVERDYRKAEERYQREEFSSIMGPQKGGLRPSRVSIEHRMQKEGHLAKCVHENVDQYVF